ncbi:MAG: aspartate kinase [Salibacteraceae bacterium]
MQVFKFGGASVKDAEAVRNVTTILNLYRGKPLVVVISAMGKSTNALEAIHQSIIENDGLVNQHIQTFTTFHDEIIDELFELDRPWLKEHVAKLFAPVLKLAGKEFTGDQDQLYDQVVSIGELTSTLIIDNHLKCSGLNSIWVDARNLIKTDSNFKEGRIDWEHTENLVSSQLMPNVSENSVIITQGFIASDKEGQTTTLGREGSDYSAAIFAYCLNAQSMTIWKDVPGVLNADPRKYSDAVKLDEVSFKEAIELAYYGASVIHPRTIQPLQRKEIKMWVKSFVDPSAAGTLISQEATTNTNIPSYINQPGQWLITIATRDFSFIVEEHLSQIFELFAKHKVKIDIMQNSAIYFTVAVHNVEWRLLNLIEDLKSVFEVKYNTNAELITIRHYNEDIIDTLKAERVVYMEQKTRETYRVLLGE